jgi:predicted histone-like DNA-binding protein
MAIKYVTVPHKIPSKPDEPVLYFPRVKASGEITLREIAQDISNQSTLSPIDIIAVLEALLLVIPRHISEGKIVRLGEFGSFHLSIKAEGSEDLADVSASKITSHKLIFSCRQGH